MSGGMACAGSWSVCEWRMSVDVREAESDGTRWCLIGCREAGANGGDFHHAQPVPPTAQLSALSSSPRYMYASC